ncbi:MAG: nitrate/nitrite transporter NrtS [Gammaproteobacteria bacterium]
MSNWTLATRRDVVVRAAKTSVLVGVILVAINHGDALVEGELNLVRLAKIVLTFAVPYCVSTYASVAAMKVLNQEERE